MAERHSACHMVEGRGFPDTCVSRLTAHLPCRNIYCHVKMYNDLQLEQLVGSSCPSISSLSVWCYFLVLSYLSAQAWANNNALSSKLSRGTEGCTVAKQAGSAAAQAGQAAGQPSRSPGTCLHLSSCRRRSRIKTGLLCLFLPYCKRSI